MRSLLITSLTVGPVHWIDYELSSCILRSARRNRDRDVHMLYDRPVVSPHAAFAFLRLASEEGRRCKPSFVFALANCGITNYRLLSARDVTPQELIIFIVDHEPWRSDETMKNQMILLVQAFIKPTHCALENVDKWRRVICSSSRRAHRSVAAAWLWGVKVGQVARGGPEQWTRQET